MLKDVFTLPRSPKAQKNHQSFHGSPVSMFKSRASEPESSHSPLRNAHAQPLAWNSSDDLRNPSMLDSPRTSRSNFTAATISPSASFSPSVHMHSQGKSCTYQKRKILVCGDGGCGKTSLLSVAVNGTCPSSPFDATETLIEPSSSGGIVCF